MENIEKPLSPGAAGHLQMADGGFCQWLSGVLQCSRQHVSLVEVYLGSSILGLFDALFSFLDFAITVQDQNSLYYTPSCLKYQPMVSIFLTKS